jgi:type III pantothenate kinase
MIVLVDVGNTRIKLGWIRVQTGERERTALTLAHGDVGLISAWLNELDPTPTCAVGVNVAGAVMASTIDAVFQRDFPFKVRWICGQPEMAGVRNAYDKPDQLGADRWASMVGLAPYARSGPVMLASFGTATTVDTLGPDGDDHLMFHGGLIFPGPALMRSSLVAGTANLPAADGPTAAYPTHTHQAITSGIAAAQAGAVLRQWREGFERFGQAPRVFSSGGGWPVVEAETQRLLYRAQGDLGLPKEEIRWLATPVLDGLARVAVEGRGVHVT